MQKEVDKIMIIRRILLLLIQHAVYGVLRFFIVIIIFNLHVFPFIYISL